MTTVNSFDKDANATYKRVKRKQLKNAETAVKEFQHTLKQQIKEDHIKAVHSYNEYLKCLLSIHKECSETINWESFAQEVHPKLPVRQSIKQFEAEYNYQTYEPSFIDFVFMQNKNKIRELLDQVETAIQEDDLIYNAVLKQFKAEASDWKKIQAITKGVIEADPAAYKDAVDFFDPFISISQLGSVLNCEIFKDYIITNVHMNINDVLPNYVLSETDSGKLSSKKMEIPMFNELCLDYIYKTALRIALESFALLPINFLIVNVTIDLFNRTSGHTEKSTVLSIKFDQDQLKELDFEKLNFSDSINGFKHQMAFTKANGFSAIEILTDHRNLSSIL